jgi:hypothetical protein
VLHLFIDTLPTELGEALRHFERAQSSQASLSDIILGGQMDWSMCWA